MVAKHRPGAAIYVSDPTVLETLHSIEQRLHDGYEKIEEGIASGRNVARWEAIWMDLLHEYEDLVDRLAA